MDAQKFKATMIELLNLCETLGFDPYKNGLRGPEDMDACRKAITRMYITAENIVDVAIHQKLPDLKRNAERLRELSKVLLKDMMVEGLSSLFDVVPARPKLITP